MMINIKDIDTRIYNEELRDFLPERIIDIHTHIWLKDHMTSPDPRAATWPARVASACSVEDLINTYTLFFPGKQVTPLIFSTIPDSNHMDEANAYVATSAQQHHFPCLLFAKPQWTAEEIEQRLLNGPFIGAKVYLTLAPEHLASHDITIFDFLPHHQLEVLNTHAHIVMLHIPRKLRLRDPVNLEQMLEIEDRYPHLKLIIAHVGRAYSDEDVGDAFTQLKRTQRMMFDISANTNSHVFTQLIEAVGPKRILFGSDLPITRMRMRRISENGQYINLVPHGLYGDVSQDPHMRAIGTPESNQLSFFLYEEILAFKHAALQTSLNKADINDIFYANGQRILSKGMT